MFYLKKQISMKVKYLIWLRNVMLILFVAQLGYFLIQKFYNGVAVEWKPSSILYPGATLVILQYLIRNQTDEQ